MIAEGGCCSDDTYMFRAYAFGMRRVSIATRIALMVATRMGFRDCLDYSPFWDSFGRLPGLGPAGLDRVSTSQILAYSCPCSSFPVTLSLDMLNPLTACCTSRTQPMTNLVAQNDTEIVLETAHGQRVLVRYSAAAFDVLQGNGSAVLLSTAPRNVLRISVARQSDSPSQRLPVTIAALAPSSGDLVLWKKDFWIAAEERQSAEEWAERIMALAYGGTQIAAPGSFC